MNKSKILCKYCQSKRVRKYGTYKETQYYYCNDCKRKFSNPETIPKMQYSTSMVADALGFEIKSCSLYFFV